MNLRTEATSQGLTEDEYDKIVEILGRDPNRVELGIFAVMWSEHCCYKSSKIHLKTLPTKGPRVLLGPGENAGVIELTEGMVLSFKIESHNHPSYIEPYQGATTGVGGILRDIFTMGTRPIAILDSLHFGSIDHPKTPFLYHGVVGGIGGYGNCMGIPTVGGETHFDSSYNGNILVNAMAIGVAKKEVLHKGVAKGVGNRVMYLGSKTGRDGIHGATMASQEFGSGNEARRPTVQVGDPFVEKLLMEASLELMEKGLLVGIQDMGAAGITCSTFEMSARGKSGMEITLDHVPLRDPTLGPYEIFLSESQERMLLVAEPKHVQEILEIAKRWDIDCVDIGSVTSTGKVVATFHGEVVVDLPVMPITEEAPLYDRPTAKLTLPQKLGEGELNRFTFQTAAEKILTSANGSTRLPIIRQYDHTVGADTVIRPGSDAAVMRIKGIPMGISAVVDSNPWFCESDPYTGTLHVVAEAARNLACVGARPAAVTNCLNFGNPEIPTVMMQIKEAIRALGDACRLFETPVTGGNVSLYNQTGEQSIKPTPTIGMIGLVEDLSKTTTAEFKNKNDILLLIGNTTDSQIYQSEFARTVLETPDLKCPPIDMKEEMVLQKTLLQLNGEQVISSAHDVSDGGLFLTLIEMCTTDLGFEVKTPDLMKPVPFWFGEYAGRVLLSVPQNKLARVEVILKNHAVPSLQLGQVVLKECVIDSHFQQSIQNVNELRKKIWERV